MPFTTPNAGLPAGPSSPSTSSDINRAPNGHHHQANGSSTLDQSANGSHAQVDQYDHSRVKHYIGECGGLDLQILPFCPSATASWQPGLGFALPLFG